MLFKIKSYTYEPIEIDDKIHSNTRPMALSVSLSAIDLVALIFALVYNFLEFDMPYLHSIFLFLR
jgi:hypothetical protein